MAYYLGITYKQSHPAAALLEDKSLVAAASEERFNRAKGGNTAFPILSLNYCLCQAGITLDDVEAVAVSRKLSRSDLGQLKKIFRKPIFDFGHSLSHAASAYFGSAFKEANVLVMDSCKTRLSAGLEKIKETRPEPGKSWMRATELLGWTPNLHEGKLMGLASYGKPEHAPRKIKQRREEHPISDYYEHFAARLQVSTNELASRLVDKAYENTGSKNLCLAGGVALNSVMNSRLLSKPNVRDIFIMPAAGNDGSAIGAAMLLYHELTGKRPAPLLTPYLGPGYDPESMVRVCRKSSLNFQECSDIGKAVAEKLEQGKIVAWFQGRMEIGPRALGNRSILASPHSMEMKELLNNKVKFREPWRPFALSLLEEKKEAYLKEPHDSQYMLLTFAVREELRKELQAGIHVDGTTRPQTVTEMNRLFYGLIREFGRLTGTYALVNTSLNVAGEPLINTPEQAVSCFLKTGLDCLAMGSLLIEK